MNDELKVYTGKETLQALLEGKVITNEIHQYKLEDDKLLYKSDGYEWAVSKLALTIFLTGNYTEVVTPQVGDWVRVTHSETKAVIITGEITEIDNLVARIEGRLISLKQDWETLSPEQVSEYKREQAFVKVGRKLNKFKSDDIVYVESLGEMAVVVSNVNDQEVRLHKINKRVGLKAKPHQLTPISFVENQVDLS